MTMAMLVAGCGSTKVFSVTHTATHPIAGTLSAPATPAPRVNPDQPVPTPRPTGKPAAAGDVNLIRAWADALRRGDVRSAAGYFALPSVMINGTEAGGQPLLITIGDAAEAEAANATLPCGAQLISTDQRGRYVNALFRLTGRPGLGGTDCGTGVGSTARTNFVIAGGRIVEWIRAPADPGDGRSPAPAVPSPAPGSQPSV